MKVLITGHKGFIGSYVVKELEKDYEVYGYDIKDGGHNDVRDVERTVRYFEAVAPDVVIHLAALTSVAESQQNPDNYYKTNTVGTWNVVYAAERAGVKKLIYTATAASKDLRSSPYAYTKFFGERAVATFSGQSVILRLFNVVGEGQNPNYLGVIPIFAKAIAGKQPITIYGDGEQTRDFIRVEDIANIIHLSAMLPLPEGYCEEFEVGSGHPITINELARKMIGKRKIEIIHAPARKEVRHSAANTAKLLQILKYEPEYPIF